MNLTNDYKHKALRKARETFGNTRQLSVTMEELAELIAALSKYQRYDDHAQAVNESKKNVLDEFADVTIVLEHVRAIYGFTDQEIYSAQRKKIDRLERWLEKDDSGSMCVTTKDRELEPKPLNKNSSSIFRCEDCGTQYLPRPTKGDTCWACGNKLIK